MFSLLGALLLYLLVGVVFAYRELKQARWRWEWCSQEATLMLLMWPVGLWSIWRAGDKTLVEGTARELGKTLSIQGTDDIEMYLRCGVRVDDDGTLVGDRAAELTKALRDRGVDDVPAFLRAWVRKERESK
jgi:hypothetical protein